MADWQPIETAPSDQWVLVWEPEADEHHHVCILMKTQVFDGSEAPEVRWRDDSGDSYQNYNPTHWMPLLDPPVEVK